jgi:cytochrome P450
VVRDAETFSSAWLQGPYRAATFAALFERAEQDPRAAAAVRFSRFPIASFDGAVHVRQREFVKKVFTPRRVRSFEPLISSLCADLADAIVDRSSVPFARDFAVPLPVQVIAYGLGMPQEDFREFKRWSDGFEALTGSPDPTREQLDAFIDAAVEFTAYILPLVEQRRREPTEDIISILASADDEGDLLDTDDVLSMCAALMMAGNETTTAALAGTMLYLVMVPELQERVRAEPSLVPALVEEGLRLTCPAQGLFRTATRDAEVGGVAIAKGDHLFVHFAAANRDEAQFNQPLIPRLDRPDKRHLGFGRGPHVCVGAPLARAEVRIALETMLDRSGHITLADRDDAVVPVGNQMTARVGELYLDITAR